MLTTNAIDGFRNYVKRTVAKAKYKVSGTYYDATISDIYIDSVGLVAIDLMMDPPVSGNVIVTAIQLFDTSGNLWIETATNITRKSIQEGIFYRFTINIYET